MKKFIRHLMGNDIFHFFLFPFKILVNYSNARRKERYLLKQSYFDFLIFLDLKVKNGPFAGLIYPCFSSFGSQLYPKFIGCYEKELWPIWFSLKEKKYEQIFDIGCAEGYYAVGLARMFPNASVKAYDISSIARDMCKKMVEINKLEYKIEVKSKCDSNELLKYDYLKKTLIICDCEGYEIELFNEIDIEIFKNVDLVIETHDFININISSILKDKFSKTHNIVSIKSIDDIEKALTYSFKEINNLSLNQKKMVVSENRPSIMEWIICFSKEI